MKTETWLDAMVKDIEDKNGKPKEEVNVKLSESDMNQLADLMIEKMSNTPDNDKPKLEAQETKKTQSLQDKDETPIDEEV